MVWNFGMGRSSFQAPRQDSQLVSSFSQSEWDAFNSDWQSRRDALANQAQPDTLQRTYMPDWWVQNSYGGSIFPTEASFTPTWGREIFPSDARWSADRQGVFYETGSAGYSPDFSGLNAEREQREAEFTAARERQNRQQQAYSQQLGSNFAGGIINDSYSAPFGGQITGQSSPFGNDPGMPGVTMPWAQPWGTPGYGGATGGQSIGGYSPQGIGAQNNQSGGFGSGSGWGGPFGKSNPWSLD